MKIDGEKICKPVHHQLSAILNRADKVRAEREQKKKAAKEPNHERITETP